MKKIVVILALINLLFVSCQEQTKEEFITKFVLDLFNENVSPKTVVSQYLYIPKDSTRTIPHEKRLKAAESFIEETRKPVSSSIRSKWIIPNYDIKKIKNPKVYPFNDYEHLNLMTFKQINTLRNRMYVLLSEDEKEILQYFVLNESQTKIMSFCLFIKDGDDTTFLIPY